MAISAAEVMILIHESALDEMVNRRNRLSVQIMNIEEEMRNLTNDIERKRNQIRDARDKWLMGVV